MNILGEQFAELLDISIEKAVELYPVIKSQFIIYNILETINQPILIGCIIGGAIIITVGIIVMVTYSYKNSDSPWDSTEKGLYDISVKILKILVPIFVILLLCSVGLGIAKYKFAPDFMLIKQLL